MVSFDPSIGVLLGDQVFGELDRHAVAAPFRFAAAILRQIERFAAVSGADRGPDIGFDIVTHRLYTAVTQPNHHQTGVVAVRRPYKCPEVAW